jgi:hypothetical protein
MVDHKMWYKNDTDDSWTPERYVQKPDYKSDKNNWMSCIFPENNRETAISMRYITKTGRKRTTWGHFHDDCFWDGGRKVERVYEWSETVWKTVQNPYWR